MENFILNSKFFDSTVVRVPESEPETSLYSGSNQKKLLIVSQMDTNQKTTDIAFLKKIFASVSVDLERDASLMVLTQNKEFSWKSITKSVDFDQLIFFGKDPKKIGLQFHYEWYNIFEHQQCRFLIAEPLDLIAADRSRKGSLWAALKEMFLK